MAEQEKNKFDSGLESSENLSSNENKSVEEESYSSTANLENYEWMDAAEKEKMAIKLLDELLGELDNNINVLIDQGAKSGDMYFFMSSLHQYTKGGKGSQEVSTFFHPMDLAGLSVDDRKKVENYRKVSGSIKEAIITSKLTADQIIKGVSVVKERLENSFQEYTNKLQKEKDHQELVKTRSEMGKHDKSALKKLRDFFSRK